MRKIILFSLLSALLLIAPPVNSDPIPDGVIIDGQATATLSWTAPTTRTSGQTLAPSEIAGFLVYWSDSGRFLADGTTLRTGCQAKAQPTRDATGCYSNVLDLSSGSTTTHALSLLLNQDSTLFFTMGAYDTDGNWSDFSNEIAKDFTVQVEVNDPGAPVLQSVEWDIRCTTNKASVTCRFIVTDPQ